VYAKRHELPCEKQHSLPGVELKSVREVLVADQAPKQENG
jgi:hypothetical protein